MPIITCKNCGAEHSVSPADFVAGTYENWKKKCPLCKIRKKQGKMESTGETLEADEREFAGAPEDIVEGTKAEEEKTEKRGRKKSWD